MSNVTQPTPAPNGTATPVATTPAAAGVTAAGLDQVKAILFGAELEKITKRLDSMEATMTENSRKLSVEMKHQIEGIRSELKTKTDTLNEASTTMRADLLKAEKASSAAVADHVSSSQKAMADNAQEIRDELSKITADIDRRKVDRAVLAAFFGETSKGLVDPGLWGKEQETAESTN